MNLSQIISQFYSIMREVSNNAVFTTDEIKRWINEGLLRIATDWDWDFLETKTVLQNAYTSVSSHPNATTLNVDSISKFFAGQTILVKSGLICEEAVISQINGLTLTLVEPGLAHTYAKGDKVSGSSLQMPPDFVSIVNLKYERIASGLQREGILEPTSRRQDEKDNPRKSIDTPKFYFLSSSYLYLVPSPDNKYRFHLNYIKRPVDLENNNDIPGLPAQFHFLLAIYAAYEALQNDGQMQKALNQLGKFNQELIRLRGRYNTRPDEDYRMKLWSRI